MRMGPVDLKSPADQRACCQCGVKCLCLSNQGVCFQVATSASPLYWRMGVWTMGSSRTCHCASYVASTLLVVVYWVLLAYLPSLCAVHHAAQMRWDGCAICVSFVLLMVFQWPVTHLFICLFRQPIYWSLFHCMCDAWLLLYIPYACVRLCSALPVWNFVLVRLWCGVYCRILLLCVWLKVLVQEVKICVHDDAVVLAVICFMSPLPYYPVLGVLWSRCRVLVGGGDWLRICIHSLAWLHQHSTAVGDGIVLSQRWRWAKWNW